MMQFNLSSAAARSVIYRRAATFASLVILSSGTLLTMPALAQQAPPTPQQRAAMLQQWLKASQVQLRAYEWVETTVIAKGGEEKSRKQNRVYYGADGKLQKIPIEDPNAQPAGREGRLGKRVKEAAKEEITAYMQSAVALVHGYVPPDPAKIKQSIDAGKFSASPSGQQVRLDFRDYLKPGDTLSTRIEIQTNRLLGLAVSSYLDTPDDAVNLDVAMGVLADGTIYSAKTVLDAKAKGITVTVENSGHRKIAP
jgi:Rieske Fe-S protein